MGKSKARISLDNFPPDLKIKLVEWGNAQLPKLTLNDIFIMLVQDWEANVADFERKHSIRPSKSGEIKRDAKAEAIEELKKRIKELEE